MEDVLRQAPLLAGLSDEDWAALSGRLRRVTVSRGDVVFHEGDPGDSLYVVTGGKLKITLGSSDGRENLLAVLGSGELLGELSLFDALPRTATATALTDSTLASLAAPAFHEFLDERPKVATILLKVLAGRLRDTNAAMADLIFTDVPGRVAKALLSFADRFGAPTDEGPHVTHDLTQEELAQLVGASRETVNKALSDFAARGWLRLDGKSVVLLEPERLAQRSR
ncbi:MAG TPA: Crp/Fnr family transcriptional regulator [Mycobacteriales bacterium]|nr:Crp/Fnr family transcriptional regulator [Mycobacteriales bacterium]